MPTTPPPSPLVTSYNMPEGAWRWFIPPLPSFFSPLTIFYAPLSHRENWITNGNLKTENIWAIIFAMVNSVPTTQATEKTAQIILKALAWLPPSSLTHHHHLHWHTINIFTDTLSVCTTSSQTEKLTEIPHFQNEIALGKGQNQPNKYYSTNDVAGRGYSWPGD